MKPISIRFKCFGPYMQEQFIDFRELEKSGLFLICGETGSGKTTILDAICYALYGRSSGDARGKLADMRCKKAGPTDDTTVEYIFSSGEDTYRFYRAVKPRKQRKESLLAGKAQSFNEDYECQLLRDGQFLPLSDAKATQTYIDHKAEEILGLKYEQFKQVVILPQGQFEKLLTSDSDKKEEILVTLFHAEKWQKIAEQIAAQVSEEKKALDYKRMELDQQLSRFGCESLEELSALTVESGQQAEALKHSCEALGSAVQQRKAEYDKAKEADTVFRKLEAAERTLAQLRAQQEAQALRKQQIDRAEQAEQIAPAHREYQQKANKDRQAQTELTGRKQQLLDAQQNIGRLQAEKAEHEAKRPAVEEARKQVLRLEGLKEVYQTLDEKKTAWDKANKARHEADSQFAGAELALQRADAALEKAVLKQQAADQVFKAGQATYLRNIGSALAEKLVDGEKCPVCGSREHPEPARPAEDHISEQALDQLTRANEAALKAVREATGLHERAAEDKQKAELAKTSCLQKAETAGALYEQALRQRVDGIENEAGRLSALRTLNRKIEAFEAADHSMQDRLTEADGKLRSETALAEAAGKTAETAAAALAEAGADWNAALLKSGFVDERDYLSACMAADKKQKLQAAFIQFSTDLAHAEEAVREQKTALGDQVRPDMAGAQQRLGAAETEKASADKQFILKEQACQEQKKSLALLEKKLPEIEQAQLRNRENMEFAKKLRGDSGVSLQRYVLGVMLTSITREANRLLKTVYGGRYQLYRTNEASGKAHKRGLELEVADQDGRRTVNSLSGGEKFLLSLSLGIGLASVVQAQGNGIRLEAMFIDEGFGALDGKCIDDAMEILESVRRSAGIVGIISHVERLEETIPAKIETRKTRSGSQCKVCC